MSGSNPVMIELRDVHKHYGDYRALRGITAAIRPGEFFSLLGPSGCGKTTLLRTIAGFEAISSGAVLIDGKDMASVPPNLRPTNMVFQSYAIFPHLSVMQNVAFGLRRESITASEKRRLAAEALEMVGLKDFERRGTQALSGGQRQRVALARALVLKPKVLLLDEPLSALDKKMREQMQLELIKLQKQVGITFVLVTHDQEEALIMSNRIAVMFDGEIAQLDSPEMLYRRPNSRRVAEFVGTMNFMPAHIVSQAGGKIEVDAQGFGRVTLDTGQVAGGLSTGQPSIGFRPETLSVLLEGQKAADREAHATVVGVLYYGGLTYYDVMLDGASQPIRLSMRNAFGRPVLEAGARSRVAWSPAALTLFG